LGLAAYLATLTEAKQYAIEEAREKRETVQCNLRSGTPIVPSWFDRDDSHHTSRLQFWTA
ncbi:hypothetical protein M436DRAFT_59214, partial [Aureobasidium namibiae CBS 147.97]